MSSTLCPLTVAYPHLVKKAEILDQNSDFYVGSPTVSPSQIKVSPKVIQQSIEQTGTLEFSLLRKKLENIEKVISSANNAAKKLPSAKELLKQIFGDVNLCCMSLVKWVLVAVLILLGLMIVEKIRNLILPGSHICSDKR